MSGIHIVPRIVPGTTYVPTLRSNGPAATEQHSPNVTQGVERTTSASPDTHHDEETKLEAKSNTQDNTLLIVVFAIIIVSLIVLILWLVSRSDTGKKWLGHVPIDKRAKLRAITGESGVAKPPDVNHKSVIGNAAEDELIKYASMPINPIGALNQVNGGIPIVRATFVATDVRPSKPESMVTIEQESDSDVESEPDTATATVEPPAVKASVSFEIDSDSDNDTKEITDTKVDNKDIDTDALIDEEFSKKLERFSKEPTDKDIKEIKKDLDRTIEDMSEDQVSTNPFPIQQLTTKGEITGKEFVDKDSLTEAGFDYNAVVKCCRGDQKIHKGHKWRFSV